MSRLIAFSFGASVAGLGYTYLRSDVWLRSERVAHSVRLAQEVIPGASLVPEVCCHCTSPL
jgi:hypothetical protein